MLSCTEHKGLVFQTDPRRRCQFKGGCSKVTKPFLPYASEEDWLQSVVVLRLIGRISGKGRLGFDVAGKSCRTECERQGVLHIHSKNACPLNSC